MESPAQVAVIGASGFIGSVLYRDLCEQGHEVVAAVRHRCALEAAFVSVVGEIGPTVDWRPTLRGCDAVVHVAGRAHFASRARESALVPYRRVNRDGSVALAEQAAELGVRRFVFVSTILVNGPDSSRPLLASDAPSPRDSYAISKLEAALVLSDVAAGTGLELVIVRPPLVYGPGVRANFLRLLRLAASGIPLPLASVPSVRSFISRWNLKEDLLVLCLRNPAPAGRVILTSDGEDISLPDLVRHLAQAMARPRRRVYCARLPVASARARWWRGFLPRSKWASRRCAACVGGVRSCRCARG
ncbi:MAG: NAD-dependent epimerase/dehydratase family protein [Pseudomonadota bacterium]